MSLEAIERCDLCWRRVPLRGVKGQSIYRGKFRSWRHWFGIGEYDPEDVVLCEDCWSRIRSEAREAVKQHNGTPEAKPTPKTSSKDVGPGGGTETETQP